MSKVREDKRETIVSRSSSQHKKLELLIRDNIEIGSPDGYLLSLCCQESAAPAPFKRPSAIDLQQNLTTEA